MNSHVIILGAGATGLAAAKVLSDEGCNVLIIEARNRIGGRILTLHDSKLNMPIELGAEFVHGSPEATWTLIRQAGARAFDLPFEHKRLRRDRLVELPDINLELKKAMGGLGRLGKQDKSFSEYLRERRSQIPADARRFAIHFVQGFDAADIERISAKSLAEEQQGIGDLEDETQFRLVDGYGSLMEFLRNSLDPRRVKIRLGLPISEIHWGKSQIEFRSHHSREAFRACRAIITLPLGVLQSSPEMHRAVRFTPDIAEWRKTASLLASGTVMKAVIRFREAFWEKSETLRDAAFLHNPPAAFPTWWTMRPLHVPVLTAWAGGPKGRALAGLSKKELLRAAITSLTPLVHLRPSRLTSLVEDLYCHNWAEDPFSRGAYSYVTVGGMNARSKLSEPIENTLFFAGEALDTSGQASTVAGALTSGRRAARQLLASR
jgi:monoamine oxidase